MPTFTMMIGLPGAGKSEIAHNREKLLQDTIVLSSDLIRKELYGDETIQDCPSKVFDIMNKRAIENLKAERNVIYDATNLRRKNRKHLLSQIPKNVKKVACIVWAKYETCLSRDQARERHVGEDVIRRMIKNFQVPFYDEGWDSILVIMTDIHYTKNDYEYWVDCNHDNPHHNNTIAEHINNVVSAALRLDCRYQNEILLAAKLHDIGKKFTKAFKDANGNVSSIAHYYDHQNVSGYYAIGYEELIGLPVEVALFVVWLINAHMEPFFNSKYYKNIPDYLKTSLDLLHQCDVVGA